MSGCFEPERVPFGANEVVSVFPYFRISVWLVVVGPLFVRCWLVSGVSPGPLSASGEILKIIVFARVAIVPWLVPRNVTNPASSKVFLA